MPQEYTKIAKSCEQKLPYVLVPVGESLACDSIDYNDPDKPIGEGVHGKSFQLCCEKDGVKNCEYVVKIIKQLDKSGKGTQNEINLQQIAAYFGISPKIISAFNCDNKDYIIGEKMEINVRIYKSKLRDTHNMLITNACDPAQVDLTKLDLDGVLMIQQKIFDEMFANGLIQLMHDFTKNMKRQYNSLLHIGIIHNDLHDANMMFDSHDIDTLKIIDYGRAYTVKVDGLSCSELTDLFHKAKTEQIKLHYSIPIGSIIQNPGVFLLSDYFDRIQFAYFNEQISETDYDEYMYEELGTIENPTNKTIWILYRLTLKCSRYGNLQMYMDLFKSVLKNFRKRINYPVWNELNNDKNLKSTNLLTTVSARKPLEFDCKYHQKIIAKNQELMKQYESMFRKRESALKDLEVYKKIQAAEHSEDKVNNIAVAIINDDDKKFNSLLTSTKLTSQMIIDIQVKAKDKLKTVVSKLDNLISDAYHDMYSYSYTDSGNSTTDQIQLHLKNNPKYKEISDKLVSEYRTNRYNFIDKKEVLIKKYEEKLLKIYKQRGLTI